MQPLDVHRLPCVEEAGATLAMIRRYGRATPGQRVVDQVPDTYGVNYTRLAAMGLDGLQAPWGVDGAVNGEIFRWWVRDILCPTLRPGARGLWENLSAHKGAGGAALLTAWGARLLRLAPYSPDGNPSAQCWSKMQTGWRRATARPVETLIAAIKQALETSTEAEIRGWFTHCGYSVQ